ncbi:MAG: hypothetical protein C0404_08635 [Verrucomicrobia bacterium]|nr:hypothetical protein [Verrucomicrobiota bacterium]
MEYSAYFCLMVSAFTAAFSLPVGRAFAVASLVCTAMHLIRSRKWPVFTATSWLAVLFVAVAVVVTLASPFRETGQSKLLKLAWFFIIPLTATLVTSRKRLIELLGAFAAGAGVLALLSCTVHPAVVVLDFLRGSAPSLYLAIRDAGSMTDAQRLMAGIIIAAGFLFARIKQGKTAYFWWVVLALEVAALLVMFKRGSWICTVGFLGVFLMLKTNWKYVAGLVIIVLGLGLMPAVQTRMSGLVDEIQTGGRVVMWTKIAPALVKEYPMGIGWRCLTSDMMRRIAPEVEADRSHLHSNPVEVLVETGRIGLAVFIVWMIWALVDAWRAIPSAGQAPERDRVISLSMLLALCALITNGLVEYNFADAEITLIYAYLIGCAAATRKLVATVEKPG